MITHKHAELADATYVVFVDSQRRYIDCTPQVSELLGYTREEMLHTKIDDISYDVAKVPELFQRYVKAGQQQGEYLLQRKDRTPLLIWYRSFLFPDGCYAAIWDPIKDWREPYMAALLELDPQKQKSNIDQALATISRTPRTDTIMERTLNEAVLLLGSLRKELR